MSQLLTLEIYPRSSSISSYHAWGFKIYLNAYIIYKCSVYICSAAAKYESFRRFLFGEIVRSVLNILRSTLYGKRHGQTTKKTRPCPTLYGRDTTKYVFFLMRFFVARIGKSKNQHPNFLTFFAFFGCRATYVVRWKRHVAWKNKWNVSRIKHFYTIERENNDRITNYGMS